MARKRRNIYEGPRSCYALYENVFVRGRGVNRYTAAQIIDLLERDLERGWTYDHACRRIPMDFDLFRRRLVYLVALARKHYGRGEAEAVRRLVNRALREAKLLRARRAVAVARVPAKRRRPRA